jgi:hypothetical protein
MQIVVNKDFSILAVEPSNVYQGSSNANSLSIFAPFSVSAYASVLLYFELPNGEVLKPYVAFATEQMPNGIGLWSTLLDGNITKYAGEVKCQLEFVGATTVGGESAPINARTDTFTINVLEGIAPELPETPSQDIYNQILEGIAYLSTTFASSESVIKKGYGENSAIQVSTETKPNSAISEGASAFGVGNLAGIRGFKILSGSGTAGGNGSYLLEGSIPEYSIPTDSTVMYSVQIGSNYDKRGYIIDHDVGMANTTVWVTNYVPYDANKSPRNFWIPDYAYIGVLDLGAAAHSEGYDSKATMIGAHAEGYGGHAYGKYAHVEGNSCEAGYSAHAEGRNTKATDDGAHAEGCENEATAGQAHAEGYYTTASGHASHSEGQNTIASGPRSHAEGFGTKATGENAHAEGYQTEASAPHTHAEGYITKAITQRAHTEGYRTTASGSASHAEGYQTEASGDSAHAEGKSTVASGGASHAAGTGTKAKSANQTVVGQYNADDADALFIVGSGDSDSQRKNAFAVRKDGKITSNGNVLTMPNKNGTLATLDDIDSGGGGSSPLYMHTVVIEYEHYNSTECVYASLTFLSKSPNYVIIGLDDLARYIGEGNSFTCAGSIKTSTGTYPITDISMSYDDGYSGYYIQFGYRGSSIVSAFGFYVGEEKTFTENIQEVK